MELERQIIARPKASVNNNAEYQRQLSILNTQPFEDFLRSPEFLGSRIFRRYWDSHRPQDPVSTAEHQGRLVTADLFREASDDQNPVFKIYQTTDPANLTVDQLEKLGIFQWESFTRFLRSKTFLNSAVFKEFLRSQSPNKAQHQGETVVANVTAVIDRNLTELPEGIIESLSQAPDQGWSLDATGEDLLVYGAAGDPYSLMTPVNYEWRIAASAFADGIKKATDQEAQLALTTELQRKILSAISYELSLPSFAPSQRTSTEDFCITLISNLQEFFTIEVRRTQALSIDNKVSLNSIISPEVQQLLKLLFKTAPERIGDSSLVQDLLVRLRELISQITRNLEDHDQAVDQKQERLEAMYAEPDPPPDPEQEAAEAAELQRALYPYWDRINRIPDDLCDELNEKQRHALSKEYRANEAIERDFALVAQYKSEAGDKRLTASIKNRKNIKTFLGLVQLSKACNHDYPFIWAMNIWKSRWNRGLTYTQENPYGFH